MKCWAKGRAKGIKLVRMDESVYELAQKHANLTNMSTKEYVAKCVLNTCNIIITNVEGKQNMNISNT